MALFRELGDQRGLVWALFHEGAVAGFEGEPEREAAVLHECLSLSREAGDKWCIAASLHQLGVLARCEGWYQRAARFCRQSVVLFRELGDKLYTPNALRDLGRVARCQAKYKRAVVLLSKAAAMYSALGDRHGAWTAHTVQELARVWMEWGRLERAAHLLGAAERLRAESGWPLRDDEIADYEGLTAALRAGLGEEAWAAEWAEGRRMTVQQAIEHNREETSLTAVGARW